MKVEKFYEQSDYPELDKHDKKADKFTYYDMIEFAELFYNHDKKTTEYKKAGIILRFIVSPLILVLLLFSFIYSFITRFLDFLIYGGEMVVFSKETRKDTIQYLIRKLKEKH